MRKLNYIILNTLHPKTIKGRVDLLSEQKNRKIGEEDQFSSTINLNRGDRLNYYIGEISLGERFSIAGGVSTENNGYEIVDTELVPEDMNNLINNYAKTLGEQQSVYQFNITYGSKKSMNETQTSILENIKANFPNAVICESIEQNENNQGDYVNADVLIISPKL